MYQSFAENPLECLLFECRAEVWFVLRCDVSIVTAIWPQK